MPGISYLSSHPASSACGPQGSCEINPVSTWHCPGSRGTCVLKMDTEVSWEDWVLPPHQVGSGESTAASSSC